MRFRKLCETLSKSDKNKPVSIKRVNFNSLTPTIIKRADTGNLSETEEILLKGYADFIVTNYNDTLFEISITLLEA